MSLERFQLEGTPDEVIARLRELPADRTYTVRVSRLIENPPSPTPEHEEFLRKLRERTPEEVEAARMRATVYTPPPIRLPPGKTVEDVIRDAPPEGATMTQDEIYRYLAELYAR